MKEQRYNCLVEGGTPHTKEDLPKRDGLQSWCSSWRLVEMLRAQAQLSGDEFGDVLGVSCPFPWGHL